MYSERIRPIRKIRLILSSLVGDASRGAPPLVGDAVQAHHKQDPGTNLHRCQSDAPLTSTNS